MSIRDDIFTTIRVQGSILPPDLLHRILSGDTDLGGLTPHEYHLAKDEKLNEAINRSWNRLSGLWSHFRASVQTLPKTDLGTTVSRERWLLPLFQELGYGRLQTVRAIEVKGKSFAISHTWGHTPIHLVGCRVELDVKKTGVAGAARSSPHSLVQELLNTSEAHLWALVSNGLTFRILRDNASLVRQAYVEFDLEAMFDSQAYADYVLLWLLCHQSRVESERPEECWLERWSKTAQEQGARALDVLRDGVEKAITALGSGFLKHTANQSLKDNLRLATLSTQDYYRQVLRLVYRLLFLFVAEDRDLLLARDASKEASYRYLKYYSTSRLRRLADHLRGTRHTDLYQTFRLVTSKLAGDAGCPELGLPALDGFLFSKDALPDLESCELSNSDLLDTIRALAFLQNENGRRPVDYRQIRSEELGSIYEALLELNPRLNTDAGTFELTTTAGHERKETGSYYTPDSLVLCLLDSALDPILKEACLKPNPEHAILQLKVCDPACGSGHFPIAAAHRIAKRLASIRTGDEEPPPADMQKALRDVIGHCIYGVDQNPMAVELCKVALWMESLEPGKPLSFLDHHIQCGNSLLGTTPELVAQGIPDAAFTAIEGDEKKLCAALKKQNKQERLGQRDMVHLMLAKPVVEYNSLESRIRTIDEAPDDTIGEIRFKAEQYYNLVVSPEYQHARQVADAWCAAFVWKKEPSSPIEAITTDTMRRLKADSKALTPHQCTEIENLSREYQFFHWHLAFPEVFASGGFDCVLGNPPWERVKIQEKEWFAERSPEIANAPNAAARKRLIDDLKAGNPALYQQFLDDSRKAEGGSHLMRNSGRYPLCGRGDINVYTVFAEGMRNLLNGSGRVGCVLPTGIATDDTTKFFFQDLLEKNSLVSLFDFQSGGDLFGDIGHARFKFCLFTAGRFHVAGLLGFECCFYLRSLGDMRDPERRFTLSAENIALLNPNTRTCPIFRFRRDAELTKAIYRRVPVLSRDAQGGRPEKNPWEITFMRMFDMANDSNLFHTREQMEADGAQLERNIFYKDGAEYLPLYEAKMMHRYNHRFGDYADQLEGSESTALPQVPCERWARMDYAVLPRYWVDAHEVEQRLGDHRERHWQLGFRSIARATDYRTILSTILPRSAVSGKLPLIMTKKSATEVTSLLANLSAFVFDYAARQKVGGTDIALFICKQFAVSDPAVERLSAPWSRDITLRDWLLPRVLELTYTARDLEPFAQDCGWSGPPFCWNADRRFQLLCELDAAFFHLYLPSSPEGNWKRTLVSEGAVQEESEEDLAQLKASLPTPRDAVAYIMDTFPIVRRKDEEWFNGDYRTKRVILEIYDTMAESIRIGKPYQTRLDPPPGPPANGLPDWPAGTPQPANWSPHIHSPHHVANPR